MTLILCALAFLFGAAFGVSVAASMFLEKRDEENDRSGTDQ